jgi:hypothetical protein
MELAIKSCAFVIYADNHRVKWRCFTEQRIPDHAPMTRDEVALPNLGWAGGQRGTDRHAGQLDCRKPAWQYTPATP